MAPSLCEVCGRVYCDDDRWARQLSDKEWEQAMNRELTPEEQKAWEAGDDTKKITAARRAHLKFTGRPFHPSE